MRSTFYSEFIAAAKQGPRIFFAPLLGAIKAVRDESARIGADDVTTKTEHSSPPLKCRRCRSRELDT